MFGPRMDPKISIKLLFIQSFAYLWSKSIRLQEQNIGMCC